MVFTPTLFGLSFLRLRSQLVRHGGGGGPGVWRVCEHLSLHSPAKQRIRGESFALDRITLERCRDRQTTSLRSERDIRRITLRGHAPR